MHTLHSTAHTNDFSGFLHSLPFSSYEHRTCYRMRVCGSDLHFTIQTIDIEIRVGFAQTHRWCFLQFQTDFANASQETPIQHFCTPLQSTLNLNWFAFIYWISRCILSFPQFVRSRGTCWTNKLNTSKWRQSISNQTIRFFSSTNTQMPKEIRFSWEKSKLWNLVFILTIWVYFQKSVVSANKCHKMEASLTFMVKTRKMAHCLLWSAENQILNYSIAKIHALEIHCKRRFCVKHGNVHKNRDYMAALLYVILKRNVSFYCYCIYMGI